METTSNTISLIQSTEFKWTAQIQYMESLESRDEAIRYAGQRGCNLIVKYDRRSGPLFDVMIDPNLGAEFGTTGNSLETVTVEIEPEPVSKTTKVARGIFGLFGRRLATSASATR